MARLPYVDVAGSPELADLVRRIKAGRGSLLNIYGMLLHTPGVTQAWMGLIDAIRSSTALDTRSREIAIIRTATLNRSAYEIRQHIPRIALASGLTEDEYQAISDWPASAGLGERDGAIIAYADAVTRDVAVPDAVFDALRPHYSVREIVELTIVIGIYNMHARFVEPLQVDVEKQPGGGSATER